MSKWLPVLCLFLMAFSPIYNEHDTPEKVTDEINNMETQIQDKQFRILSSTPVLTELEDREIVIVSSNGWTALMFRENIEIYAVEFSCVTVQRGD